MRCRRRRPAGKWVAAKMGFQWRACKEGPAEMGLQRETCFWQLGAARWRGCVRHGVVGGATGWGGVGAWGQASPLHLPAQTPGRWYQAHVLCKASLAGVQLPRRTAPSCLRGCSQTRLQLLSPPTWSHFVPLPTCASACSPHLCIYCPRPLCSLAGWPSPTRSGCTWWASSTTWASCWRTQSEP